MHLVHSDLTQRISVTRHQSEWVCGASANSKLVSASRRGVVKEMKESLEAGADPNAKDEWDNTGLICAAMKGETEACSLLIEHKADVDFLNKKNLTAVYFAAEKGHVDTLKVLLEAKAHADIYDELRQTPLFLCSVESTRGVQNPGGVRGQGRQSINKDTEHSIA